MVRISIWVTNLISYLWSPEDGCWLTAMSGGQQLMTLYGIHAKIALVTCLNNHLPKKGKSKCCAEPPTAQGAFQPTPLGLH